MSKELEKAIKDIKSYIHVFVYGEKARARAFEALRLVIEAAERDLQSRQAMKDIPPDTALAPKRFTSGKEVTEALKDLPVIEKPNKTDKGGKE